MEKINAPVYVVVLIEITTFYSTLILCADYNQLQKFMSEIDETKYKLSVMEVDDVCAYTQWKNQTDLNEEDFPFTNLN